MITWNEVAPGFIDLLAFLGGGAFFWKLFELYRDRVRVRVADITYDEHHDDGPTLSMELDNLGRHPILLPRLAAVQGIHLGYRGHRRDWVRPKTRVHLRLLGNRRVEPVTSHVLLWQLDEEEIPEGGLYFVYWIRVIFRLANNQRTVTVRVPRLGVEPVGPVRYWTGYLIFRHLGKLTRSGRGRQEDD